MHDITFGHNGPYGGAWMAAPQPATASSIAIPGLSLMSMNALFCTVFCILLQCYIYQTTEQEIKVEIILRGEITLFC